MADNPIPHFHNTEGAHAITIGAGEFMCIGALPPHDHPHVFLDMGDETEIVCPYCSTVYRRDEELSPQDTRPKGCLYQD